MVMEKLLIEHPHLLSKFNFSACLLQANCVVARHVCAYVLWLCLHRPCRYMYTIL